MYIKKILEKFIKLYNNCLKSSNKVNAGKNLTYSYIYLKILLGELIMVYTYKETIQKYKDDYNIRKALKIGELYRVEKGIYSDNKYANPLIMYSKKYPNSYCRWKDFLSQRCWKIRIFFKRECNRI